VAADQVIEHDPAVALPQHPCLLAENEHGTFCVPVESAHRPAARLTLGGQVWEPATLALLREASAGGDVVTAGAYFGDMLPGTARSAPGSTVWAFEPNPVNWACAAWTVRLNRLANVRLFNAALGARRATTELVVRTSRGQALGGISHLRGTGDAQSRWAPIVRTLARRPPPTTPCDVLALDDVIDGDRPLALIHLDVEGFEAAALQGAVRLLDRWRPLLLLESPVEGSEVWGALERLGYSRVDELDGNRLYRAASSSS
jgi:FkbM family methyltransferase